MLIVERNAGLPWEPLVLVAPQAQANAELRGGGMEKRTKRKWRMLTAFLVASAVVFLVQSFMMPRVSGEYSQSVIRVPYDYSTIQEAVNAVPAGGMVLVSGGTYYEHVVVNKTLNLIGQNRDDTFVDGNGSGRVVTVSADNVQVDGFTLMNGKFGIDATGNNLTISDNVIISNEGGLRLGGSNGSTILGNIITGNEPYDNSLAESSKTMVYGNSMVGDSFLLTGGGDNVIRHNNFINVDAYEDLFYVNNTWNENFWDGNVWREERHALPSPYGPIPIMLGNSAYLVGLASASTVSVINSSQPKKEMFFRIAPSTSGYFNITIPKNLLRGPWNIAVGFQQNMTRETTITENQTYTSIYSAYNITTPFDPYDRIYVEIIGSWVVPEFVSPVTLIVMMFLTIAVVAVAMRVRKKARPEGTK
jgi:parallel beta-helix repeat protein